MQNTRLNELFVNQPLELRFIASALEQLMGEEKTNIILDEMNPPTPPSRELYKERPLGFYAGMSREQLLAVPGIEASDVSKIYTKLGVKEVSEDTEKVEPQPETKPTKSTGTRNS